MNKKNIFYIATVIFSIMFLFIGNIIATQDLTIFDDEFEQKIEKAKVEEIVSRNVEENNLDESASLDNVRIVFEARILSGVDKGETVTAVQIFDSFSFPGTPEVQQDDKIVIIYTDIEEQAWQFMEYVRTDNLLILAILLVLFLLLFGHRKGFNTIISLVFTCAAIFAVFIPSILSGKNIYISSTIICLYSIIMTFLIINGYNKKTFVAALGCFGGVVIAGLLTLIMDNFLYLTGILDEQSVYLTYLPTESPIDLKAIIFAAIIIGAMGAIMDVSMSISSSLWELNEKTDSPSFDSLYKSGINIGRDVMGTMANTLILAYIGSSLSVILLLSVYSTSLFTLLNRELIVVEILQALVGSFGILFALPLTSIIAAITYPNKTNK